jgi:transcriptional regulator with XRE-family HTH domain
MKSGTPEVVWSGQIKGMRRQMGQRIVVLRQERSLSQTELADLLGVPRERLAKWECGNHAPPPEDLVALSKVLDVSTDEILIGRKPLLSRELRDEIMEHIQGLIDRVKKSS